MLAASEAWKSAYPGARVGVLVLRDVVNLGPHVGLEQQKEALENQLCRQFPDRAAIKALATIQAYDAYYKRFKKTYHVQLQLESVALKGKSIPRVSALVEAMFMAELKNQLLTAGHDLETIQMPVRLDVSNGSERYTLLSGQEQELKPGDMFIADAAGVISSVLYGPDSRTHIRPETTHVLFGVYAPPGISRDAVSQHLDDIRNNVQMVAPQSQIELSAVYGAQ